MLRSSGNESQSSREKAIFWLRSQICACQPAEKRSEATRAFGSLKKAGCKPETLTELILDAAFARSVYLHQRTAKVSPSFVGSLWGIDAREQKRLQADLRRIAGQLDLLFRSAVLSPSAVLPRLLPAYEWGGETSRSRAIRALAARDFPRLPALLRALSEYLERFGVRLRAESTPARLTRFKQEAAVVALLEYVAVKTRAAPPFAELALLLHGAISFLLRSASQQFKWVETAKDPFSRKALEALYRRRNLAASIQLATAGTPKSSVS